MSIKLSNVTYTYGIGTPFEKTALYDTDVEIHEGEFVGIIGHTGSGKSTLMNILGCLDTQSSGVCRIGQVDAGPDPQRPHQADFRNGDRRRDGYRQEDERSHGRAP